MKKYLKQPEVQARRKRQMKEYNQRPEVKDYQREYRQKKKNVPAGVTALAPKLDLILAGFLRSLKKRESNMRGICESGRQCMARYCRKGSLRAHGLLAGSCSPEL